MNNSTTTATATATSTPATATNIVDSIRSYPLPVRLAWRDRDRVIAGSLRSWGDAGWTVLYCGSRAEIERIAREYPAAEMPCWRRMGL